MKRITIFLLSTIAVLYTYAGANDPCKRVKIPAELSEQTVFFEVPTYGEYVNDIVRSSMKTGVEIAKDNILEEEVFNIARDEKIKMIEKVYEGTFEIKTSKELRNADYTKGYVFQEEIITKLVKSYDFKFENYTRFSLKSLASNETFVLVNPESEDFYNCINEQSKYKFKDIIEVLNQQ